MDRAPLPRAAQTKPEYTPYHFADITPEQAMAINANFSIEVYGGVHGTRDNVSPADYPTLDMQYEALLKIVDSLDATRGDVWFQESRGHKPTTNINAEREQAIAQYGSYIVHKVEEDMRAKRTIDPFTYASYKAAAKGIPVIQADISRDANDEFLRVTKQKANGHNWDPDNAYHSILYSLREEQAANTIKDCALHALPNLNGRKPRYILPFGAYHVEPELRSLFTSSRGIEMAFVRLGIEAKLALLPSIDPPGTRAEIYREHEQTRIERDMAPLVTALARLAVAGDEPSQRRANQ